LTSVVGRILESIFKDAIFIHLNKHGLIKDSQHGFTSGMVLHMGKSEINRNYEINHTQLKTHKVEQDLGILVDGNMKFSEHCNSVVNSANATLGMIKRSI